MKSKSSSKKGITLLKVVAYLIILAIVILATMKILDVALLKLKSLLHVL